MTEQEARTWFESRGVPRGTMALLDRFAEMVAVEQLNQNLVARSTLSMMWSRHFLDSAQLIDLAPTEGEWIDLGSGPGFPGLVVALVAGRSVTLVESRTKRIDFLHRAVAALGLSNIVAIVGSRLEVVPSLPYRVISARAFAPLPKLLSLASRFSQAETVWLLPKGRGAERELEQVRPTWHGNFTIVPSLSDPESAILVASDVRLRNSR